MNATAAPAQTSGDVGISSALLMTAVGGFVDAYLFLRHGVFAFAQTGNVVFLAVNVAQGHAWSQYLWPILAYLLGLCAAQALRALWPRLPHTVIAVTMAVQVIVFAVLAALPGSAPAAAYVVTLSFVGGVRLELFRTAGGFSFVSIATTGNLMRFVQAAAAVVRDRSAANLRAVGVTGGVVVVFIAGAFAGAIAAHSFGSAGLWGAVVLEAIAVLVFLLHGRPPVRAA